MKYKKLSTAFIAAALVAVSTASMASGSFGARSGSGIQDPYNYGKIIFHKKINCNGCSLAMDSVDKRSAMKIVDKVNNNAADIQNLSHRERKAVAFYLNKRFDI